jgi:hypothetical protein
MYGLVGRYISRYSCSCGSQWCRVLYVSYCKMIARDLRIMVGRQHKAGITQPWTRHVQRCSYTHPEYPEHQASHTDTLGLIRCQHCAYWTMFSVWWWRPSGEDWSRCWICCPCSRFRCRGLDVPWRDRYTSIIPTAWDEHQSLYWKHFPGSTLRCCWRVD